MEREYHFMGNGYSLLELYYWSHEKVVFVKDRNKINHKGTLCQFKKFGF